MKISPRVQFPLKFLAAGGLLGRVVGLLGRSGGLLGQPGSVVVLSAATLLAAGCRPSAEIPTTDANGTTARSPKSVSTEARFEDVAASRGIDCIHRNGEEAGHYSILESLGGGGALLDYDGDGHLDVLVSGGGRFGPDQQILGLRPCLYRRVGGSYSDVSAVAGLDEPTYHYNHAVSVSDYNEDGFPDVLITGYGGLVLLRNQGDGTFEAVTEQARLEDPSWSSSAAFGDLNGDGFLDLYVAHYLNWSFDNHPYCASHQPGQRDICPPREFEPLPDRCWFSDGAGGFNEQTESAGLQPGGKGLGVLLGDIDLDGDLDIYVGNDNTPNFLYVNDGQGRFTDIGLASGAGMGEMGGADGSMGLSLGDFDLDGLPDLWVSNFESESFALYKNMGRGLFRHLSREVGITSVGSLYVGWGTTFFDFDLDGDEDLFATNGHVIRFPLDAPLKQPPLLFQNEGGKRFVNVADSAGPYFRRQHMGRGLSCGDVDRDGRPDLLVVPINEPVALLLNRTPTKNHWLALRLIARQGPRDAIGARVRLRTARSEQTRQRLGGGSYASTHAPQLQFGLGNEQTVKEIEIHWPSGQVQRMSDIGADQELTILEPR